MNIEQVKEVLEAVGYPVDGDDLITVLDDLHDTYGPQVVGSSVRHLGDAAPLYVKAGQVAFMVDNEEDFLNACHQIKANLKKQESSGPVVLKGDKRSRWLSEIERAIDYEVEGAKRTNRDLSSVHDSYLVEISDGRKWMQKQNQNLLLEDLLAEDDTRNLRAAKALQTLFVYKR